MNMYAVENGCTYLLCSQFGLHPGLMCLHLVIWCKQVALIDLADEDTRLAESLRIWLQGGRKFHLDH